MKYSEKLKDPRWQKKRLEILNRDEFKCRVCNDATSTLHVHHKYYKPDTAPWDYPDITYLALCETCHDKAHEQKVVVDTDTSAPKWLLCSGMGGGFEYYFGCPNCGGENLHQRDKGIYHREEDSKTGLRVLVSSEPRTFINDDCMDCNPSPRRNGLRIDFWCENCDMISELQIIQHKGTEFVSFGPSHIHGKQRQPGNYW